LRTVIGAVPWLAVGVGGILVVVGVAQLLGRRGPQVPGGLLGAATRRLPWPRSGVSAMAGYGAAYAVAALSCSLALLLAVVAQAVATGSLLRLLAVFAAYSAGSTVLLTLLAVTAALARGALTGHLRRLLPYVTRLGGAVLTLAGFYLIAYWWPVVTGRPPGGPVADLGGRLSAAVTSTLNSALSFAATGNLDAVALTAALLAIGAAAAASAAALRRRSRRQAHG
ncbi:MAG: cytochrome C biogenesis protein, partial [Actinomycetota bacterium]|nr:cytochrome C biogenesis protein [Actinomycetota bacterium]